MEKFVTLLCTRDETVLIDEISRLAHLAGIELKLDLRIGHSEDSTESDTLLSLANADAEDKLAYRDDISESRWPRDTLVLTSPRTWYFGPRRAVVVSLTGDSEQHGLVLPQDEEQILSLLTSERVKAKIIGVRGLISGVNTTAIAALLAQACFDRFAIRAKSRDNTTLSNAVCLVDFTGSTLPLGDYLAPVQGRNWDWHQLLRPGLPAPARLAAGLPRWEQVAVLSGSGFIPPSKYSQSQAVIRALSQGFNVVVVDLGTGLVPADISLDAQVWVGNSSRRTVLAWEDLILPGDIGTSEICNYLIQEATGTLPANQVNQALRQAHQDVEVFRFLNHPKDQKLWDCEGIFWPPTRKLASELDFLSWQIWNDLRQDQVITEPLWLDTHEFTDPSRRLVQA